MKQFLSDNKHHLSNKRSLTIAAAAVVGLGVALFATRSFWGGSNVSAQTAPRARVVSVEIAKAERKPVPLEVDSIGTVTPISSVALKSRLETTIVGVHFEDGARVNEGDLLFTLDSRQIEAQIAQAEGNLAKDRAQLEQAQRDVKRYSELVAKGATTQLNLDNALTAVDSGNAVITADQAVLDNLRVQKSYTKITAPIAGRISAANVKIGNFVRPADTAPLATINQMAPVYVSFAVPQRVLSDLRDAMQGGVSKVVASLPGDKKSETGSVAMIENSVDATTGMVTLRGKMDNASETLWPGTLVNARLVIRTEDAVVVPSAAVQRNQTGNFIFVVEGGKALIRPVTIERTSQGQSVISSGLKGGEDVVVDGQLSLAPGSSVEARGRKAGA